MPTLDYDVTFAMTSFWHAEVFDCTTGKVVFVTPAMWTRAAACQAAELWLEAQEDPS